MQTVSVVVGIFWSDLPAAGPIFPPSSDIGRQRMASYLAAEKDCWDPHHQDMFGQCQPCNNLP